MKCERCKTEGCPAQIGREMGHVSADARMLADIACSLRALTQVVNVEAKVTP